MAQKAADAAWTAYGKIDPYQAQAKLGMIQREVVLKYRRPTSEQVAEAKKVLAIEDEAALDQALALIEMSYELVRKGSRARRGRKEP